jgi:DNA-binding Lrp family transcriptional regulator
MDKANLDTLDNKIIRLLTENGRMPIGEMAKKLNVTSPTIRNRINNLEKSGVFKVSGLSRHWNGASSHGVWTAANERFGGYDQRYAMRSCTACHTGGPDPADRHQQT